MRSRSTWMRPTRCTAVATMGAMSTRPAAVRRTGPGVFRERAVPTASGQPRAAPVPPREDAPRASTRSARARATRERMVPTGQPATSAASA